MVGSCRQVELTHRGSHQTLTFILQLAKLPYLPYAHVRIAKDRMLGIKFREAFALFVARFEPECESLEKSLPA